MGVFGLFLGYFGGRDRSSNFIVTYLCRLSTLVWEAQPYLFLFDLGPFGGLLALFEPFGALYRVKVRSKMFLVLELQPFIFLCNSAPFWAS